jgi:hypothetical protein
MDKQGPGQAKPADVDLDDPFKSSAPADDPFASPDAKPAAADDDNPFAGGNAGGAKAGAGAAAPDDDDPFK